MNETAIHALARRAGIAVEWNDYAGKPHTVSIESIARILNALGLPCETTDELSHSEQSLKNRGVPRLVTATLGQAIELRGMTAPADGHVHVILEDGSATDLAVRAGPRGIRLSGIDTAGYHSVTMGGQVTTLAVTPARCVTMADLAPHERTWGIAAQIYGLRGPGDCGIGDATGVAALARQAATLRADALALSPVHALFGADPNHFSPYSPSSRLFYNPLYADARIVFGDRVDKAFDAAGLAALARDLEQQALIDWPRATRAKMSALRYLFDDFSSTDLASGGLTPQAKDFAAFRQAGGALLEDHARFEALHAKMLAAGGAWNWSEWPVGWRDPHSAEVASFAHANPAEISFHCFLQWITNRSLAAAQREARDAGMRIGLLADLAVGMSGAGSHAWTSQNDILVGLEIGAPPDLYNANGQNWGLTTFSPRALSACGFAPFIATLRAALRHAGGLRIDHAMGLLRLWVVPRGADAKEGAYLAYPIDDLMRLTALESHRHRAIVVGEDLGTVPAGFRERLAANGIYGMRVLWFERERNRFTPPQAWSADTLAMTSTHDLPTVAGWWRGKDIETRVQLGLAANSDQETAERSKDRRALWRAFRRAGAASGDMPSPDETPPVADAAVKFIAQTDCELALLPLEDALALGDQPNLPGTIEQHPNWRRRYPGSAAELLGKAGVRRRLEPLSRRGRR
jgi:4-alpha-glucanotransferase